MSEVIDTAFALEDEIGLALAPLVVNDLLADAPDPASRAALRGLDPDLVESIEAVVSFTERRCEVRDEQLRRLTEQLPLPRVHLPHLDAADVGRAELDQLADLLDVAADVLTDDGGDP